MYQRNADVNPADRDRSRRAAIRTGDSTATPAMPTVRPPACAPKPTGRGQKRERRKVVNLNKLGAAAIEVRRQFVTTLLARLVDCTRDPLSVGIRHLSRVFAATGIGRGRGVDRYAGRGCIEQRGFRAVLGVGRRRRAGSGLGRGPWCRRRRTWSPSAVRIVGVGAGTPGDQAACS